MTTRSSHTRVPAAADSSAAARTTAASRTGPSASPTGVLTLALGLSALLAIALSMGVALPAGAQPYSEWVHYRRIDLDTPWGPTRVLVTFPRRGDHSVHPPGERYPVLIALHGRSEARQGPERGYLGWATRYGLPDAFGALLRGRLYVSDYRRLVRAEHLDHVNTTLRTQPFQGLMVVTPYMPDFAGEAIGSAPVDEYGDWLAGPLLESVRARFPGAAQSAAGTGIDGVSLGGRVALEAGFSHPESFGVVGCTQPAVRVDGDALAELALEASRTRSQRVRLLSSDEDPFLVGTRGLSSSLRARRVTHTLTVVPGAHDYEFNRGPGVLEMLLFHDRALEREPMED